MGSHRNYLIPRGMANKATGHNLKAHQRLMQNVEARRAQYENLLNEVARQIDGTELFFERRAASTGKLFGSVTTGEIALSLEEATGVDINRRRISQQGLRELGTHEVTVRLGTENPPTLLITIVREGELAAFMAAREAGEVEEYVPDIEEVPQPVSSSPIIDVEGIGEEEPTLVDIVMSDAADEAQAEVMD